MLRERRKLSGRALSHAAGLSPSYVGKVENGEIEPSLKAFAKIALALEMTSAEMIYLISVEARR